MPDSLPTRMLVASDFHLGPGWDEVTNTCVATENFLADDAFAAWLAHHADEAGGTLVILNGDIFDVLRIDAVPSSDRDFDAWAMELAALGVPRPAAELRADVSKVERKYGLKTHDYKTVWKLLLTARGHRRFFEGLAAWVGAGGRVSFVTGNHDVELHWPLVQAAIRRHVAEAGAGEQAAADRIAFPGESVTIGNLHVEHGHRFESMTRVDGGPTLPPPRDDEINLPLGSFVNRYFINHVEALDPFLDNVRPSTRALARLARQRPLKLIDYYAGAWKFLLRALRRRRWDKSVLLIGLGLSLPVVLPIVLILANFAGKLVSGLLGLLLSAAFPFIAGAVVELVRRRPRTDHLTEVARKLVDEVFAGRQDGPLYVCMGHTHVTAVRRIEEGRDDRLYFNTGTWIALWPENRPDLLGRTVYSYADFQADGDGYRGRMLEWDATVERPRPATILVPAAA